MKIAIIGFVLNPNSGARSPIDLAYYLNKLGHQIYFFAFSTNKDKKTESEFKKIGITTVLIQKSKTPFLGAIENFYKLYSELIEVRPDCVNTHIPLSLLLAPIVAGIPTVLSYHGTQFNVLNERFIVRNALVDLFNLPLNVIIYIKSLISIRLATRVVAISNYTKTEAKRLYGREGITIYNGASPEVFRNRKIKTSQSTIVNVLSVSRITPYKHFEKIIKAINSLSESYNVRLTIVGSSPQPVYLKYLKRIKNKNTEIFINVSDNKLANFYERTDIYATADEYLFFGLPILEAAVFSKPSIAYNHAAAHELIVHGKSGFVANNDQEFTIYLEELTKKKDLRFSMGKKAKDITRKFSWIESARRYEEIFKKIIKVSDQQRKFRARKAN